MAAAEPAPAAAPAAAAAEWRPVPTCPAAHALDAKTVAGSWFASCKTCKRCGASLSAGVQRRSCKACSYHLCAACGDKRADEMLSEEITLTVYRAAQLGILPGMGVEEDALQVAIVRGATVGALKLKIAELYSVPVLLQVLRRDADSTPLGNQEPLRYDDGDVVYLSVGGGGLFAGGGFGGTLGVGGGAGGLMEMMSRAAADATEALSGALEEAAARARELEKTEYTLNVVLLARGARPEKRCKLTVVAAARVQEVLDMVKLELDIEDEALYLEFAGDKLPPAAPVHMVGLRDGDTVMVAAPEDSRSSL